MSNAHPGHGGTDPQVALTALWGALRLAVLDVETCNGADGDHIIDLALLTYRKRTEVGSLTGRFNPGVPVDPASQAVHGLTDADLASEKPFADAVPALASALTPTDGERLVLVAHNAPFDVSRLQLEFAREGAALPDIPVLDTVALAKHCGLRAGSLADLLDALGLVNTAPHTARGDADATARAALALLRMAAAAGAHDVDDLLTRAMAGRKSRTGAIKAAGKSRRRDRGTDAAPAVDLPDAHVTGHAELLPPDPAAHDLAGWLAQVTACAQLRCPYLEDRVHEAPLPPDELLTALEPALDAALTRNDPPAVATVLGALLPLLAQLPNRPAALRWHRRWAARLDAAGGCPADDRCPACRDRAPCPLDTWHQPLAAAALGPLRDAQSARSFLHTTGVESGRGVFSTWREKKLTRLADYAAWLVHQHWVTNGQPNRAELVARHAWKAGGRDPRLVAAYARRVAAPGSVERLTQARDICDETFLERRGSTDDGWAELRAARNRIAGQLARRRPKTTGAVDANGKAIPVRRHHPDQPERTRRARFALDG